MQQQPYCLECGRFLSVDSIGVDPTSRGNFSRYAYAKDNPYRYTDPNGRKTGSVFSAINAWTTQPYLVGETSTGQMLSGMAYAIQKLDNALA